MLIEKLNIDEEVTEYVQMLQDHNSEHTKYKGLYFIGKIQEEEFKQRAFNYEKVQSELINCIGEENIYITPNTFKSFRRLQKELWQLRFLYQDLDVLKDTKLSINQAYGELMDLCEDNIIPYPTMVVNTGRGLQAYWNIGDYSANSLNISFWKDIQECLFKRLEHLGADKKVSKDTARVLRIPGCINSRNKEMAHIWYSNIFNKYKLADLKEEYFKEDLIYKPKKKKPVTNTVRANKVKVTKQIKYLEEVKTPYTLHKARVQDILKVLSMRNFNLEEGKRNDVLFILAYHYGIVQNINQNQLYRYISGINDKLLTPLDNREVNGIVKNAYKYYLEFKEEMEKNSDLKNSPLNHSVCFSSLGTAFKGFKYSYLVYKNTTIIDLLGITDKESLGLVTLIGNRVSLDRKNDKRRLERRGGDPNGLTKKQQEQQDKRKKAIELKAQGLSLRKIAKEMEISLSTLQNILK